MLFVYNCKLKDYREAAGLTQDQLAIHVGCSQNTISNIECMIYQPTVKLAMRIANYFDCYIEDIFFVEGDK